MERGHGGVIIHTCARKKKKKKTRSQMGGTVRLCLWMQIKSLRGEYKWHFLPSGGMNMYTYDASRYLPRHWHGAVRERPRVTEKKHCSWLAPFEWFAIRSTLDELTVVIFFFFKLKLKPIKRYAQFQHQVMFFFPPCMPFSVLHELPLVVSKRTILQVQFCSI